MKGRYRENVGNIIEAVPKIVFGKGVCGVCGIAQKVAYRVVVFRAIQAVNGHAARVDFPWLNNVICI